MKIVSDVDEVVVQYLQGFCDFYNSEVEDIGLKHSDFETFSFADTLGISHDTSDRFRDEYMRSQFFDNMKLIPGAKEGLEILAKSNSVDFVTVRPNDHRVKTFDYFDRVLGVSNSNIYFEKGCKLDRLKKLGADVIIEDSSDSRRYAEEGFKVILYDRKWNRHLEHENIYRCKNWVEIVAAAEVIGNV